MQLRRLAMIDTEAEALARTWFRYHKQYAPGIHLRQGRNLIEKAIVAYYNKVTLTDVGHLQRLTGDISVSTDTLSSFCVNELTSWLPGEWS